MDTTTIPDEQAVQAMTQYGGSFMKQLGRLWQSADPLRRARLKEAFRDDFDRYRDMAGQPSSYQIRNSYEAKCCTFCFAFDCTGECAGDGQMGG